MISLGIQQIKELKELLKKPQSEDSKFCEMVRKLEQINFSLTELLLIHIDTLQPACNEQWEKMKNTA